MIASTPPMGWNSWDCYGAEVTEETVRKNAAYMAEHLKEYGWEYIVVDIQWAGGKYANTAGGRDQSVCKITVFNMTGDQASPRKVATI